MSNVNVCLSQKNHQEFVEESLKPPDFSSVKVEATFSSASVMIWTHGCRIAAQLSAVSDSKSVKLL